MTTREDRRLNRLISVGTVLILVLVFAVAWRNAAASIVDEKEPVGKLETVRLAAARLSEGSIGGVVSPVYVNGEWQVFMAYQPWPSRDTGIVWPHDENCGAASSCASDENCETTTDRMCSDAGHGGADGDTVTRTMHADGTTTCSADCQSGSAVAFVRCNCQPVQGQGGPIEPEPDLCDQGNGPERCDCPEGWLCAPTCECYTDPL